MTAVANAEGCLLGLALSDALGAAHEGGVLERFAWRLLGRTRAGEMRWTDDTQMTLDVAESLIEHGAVDPDDLARRFAASYRWSRGYGPGAARLLKRIRAGADWRAANRSVFPDGSYGNGGAMRAPAVGMFHARSSAEECASAARTSAEVTHAHPLGQEGAVLVAAAVAAAARDGDVFAEAAEQASSPAFRTRFEVAGAWLAKGESPDARTVVQRLGHGVAAAESCVTAIYIAVRSLPDPFLRLTDFVARCGGDADTIGAMAGAIWGARNGAASLPGDALARLEQRERIAETARRLYERATAEESE